MVLCGRISFVGGSDWERWRGTFGRFLQLCSLRHLGYVKKEFGEIVVVIVACSLW